MKLICKPQGLKWPVGALALVVIVLAAGSALAGGQAVSGQAPVQTPAAVSARAIGADQAIIQGLREALSSNRLSEANRQALQKKLEYSERLAAQRAAAPDRRVSKDGAAQAAPVAMPAAIPQEPGQPASQAVEHIIAGSEGMVHSWEGRIINMWQGLYNGIPTQALAGSAADHAEQGLVIVIEYPVDGSQPVKQAYRAPSSGGALRIVERQGSRLRCETEQGAAAVFFNLDQRVFEIEGQ